jgi:ABC-type molybdate transport system substrate-binding protein
VSALDTLAGAAGDQVWKVAAAALAGLLLVVGVAGGTALWLQDRALTQAQADLKAANIRADDYQSAIREQNRATEALAKAKVEADARGAAARAQAAEQGKRFDGALQQMAGVHATSCAGAMPFVNKLWEDVR